MKSLDSYAEHGDLELINHLLENYSWTDVDIDYAFCLAAENGHLKVVEVLLDHGADLQAGDNYAIENARENGHSEVVTYLYGKLLQLSVQKAYNNHKFERTSS